jgi:hypothetical protein
MGFIVLSSFDALMFYKSVTIPAFLQLLLPVCLLLMLEFSMSR